MNIAIITTITISGIPQVPTVNNSLDSCNNYCFFQSKRVTLSLYIFKSITFILNIFKRVTLSFT